MSTPVNRQTLSIDLPGRPVALHRSLVEALTGHSTVFVDLLAGSHVPARAVAAAVEALLGVDDVEGPVAWRFVQTNAGFLGPAFFAVQDHEPVASCGAATAIVTRDGFQWHRSDGLPTPFMAVEETKTTTALIRPDGHDVALSTGDEVLLARALSHGHSYVTAVPASFKLAVQQPLLRLRAGLAHVGPEESLRLG